MDSSSKLKQRMIGAAVIIALIALMLPFILNKEPSSQAPIKQEIALVPEAPSIIRADPVEPASVPQQQPESVPVYEIEDEDPVAVDLTTATQPTVVQAPVKPKSEPVQPKPVVKPVPAESVKSKAVAQPKPASKPEPVKPKAVAQPKSAPKPEPKPVAQAKPQAKPAPAPAKPGLNANNLPASWSVQLAKLSKVNSAEALRDKYRGKQYNAYVRSEGGFHYVRIGPLVKQADAQAMCKQLKAREGQDCFVVSFKP